MLEIVVNWCLKLLLTDCEFVQVRERCAYEWNMFQERLAAADDAALREERGQTYM